MSSLITTVLFLSRTAHKLNRSSTTFQAEAQTPESDSETQGQDEPLDHVEEKLYCLRNQVADLEQQKETQSKKRTEDQRAALGRLKRKQESLDKAQKILDDAEKGQTEAKGRREEMQRLLKAKSLELQNVEGKLVQQMKYGEVARDACMTIHLECNQLVCQKLYAIQRAADAEKKTETVEAKRKAEEEKLSVIEKEKKKVRLQLKKLKEMQNKSTCAKQLQKSKKAAATKRRAGKPTIS